MKIFLELIRRFKTNTANFQRNFDVAWSGIVIPLYIVSKAKPEYSADAW